MALSEAEERRHSDPLRPFMKRAVARMAINAGFEGTRLKYKGTLLSDISGFEI